MAQRRAGSLLALLLLACLGWHGPSGGLAAGAPAPPPRAAPPPPVRRPGASVAASAPVIQPKVAGETPMLSAASFFPRRRRRRVGHKRRTPAARALQSMLQDSNQVSLPHLLQLRMPRCWAALIRSSWRPAWGPASGPGVSMPALAVVAAL